MGASVFDKLSLKTASFSGLRNTEVWEDVALSGSAVGGIVSV